MIDHVRPAQLADWLACSMYTGLLPALEPQNTQRRIDHFLSVAMASARVTQVAANEHVQTSAGRCHLDGTGLKIYGMG